jgi:membrane glycosyltransferase
LLFLFFFLAGSCPLKSRFWLKYDYQNQDLGWNMTIKIRILVEIWLSKSGSWLKYDCQNQDLGWNMTIKVRILVEIWLSKSGSCWNMIIKVRILVEIWLSKSGSWLKSDCQSQDLDWNMTIKICLIARLSNLTCKTLVTSLLKDRLAEKI